MPRDPFERIVSATIGGIYESNYLKANSPDGSMGLWLKHNILRPNKGASIAEFWFILSSRDAPPVVAKREVPLDSVALTNDAIGIRSGKIELSGQRACGQLANCAWTLTLSDADAPLLHFPWDWMYTAGFPKKKAITPAPHLRFDGEVSIGTERFQVDAA